MDMDTIYFLDGFCGAGGASTGISRVPKCKVVVAINHDDRAIAAHSQNHPDTLHLNTDIREVDLMVLLAILASKGLRVHVIWWSAECTHFSNAKGGESRDPESRMLSEQLFRYIAILKPDMVFVENVTEFKSWAPILPIPVLLEQAPQVQSDLFGNTGASKPVVKSVMVRHGNKRIPAERKYALLQTQLIDAMTENTRDLEMSIRAEMDALETLMQSSGLYKLKPDGRLHMSVDSEHRGSMYTQWRDHIVQMGYRYDSRTLNAADYGAYQSRKRYFAVFVRRELGIVARWPEQTHAKQGSKAIKLNHSLQPWKACREILQMENPGRSILFGRNDQKELTDATCSRIQFGMNRFRRESEPIEMIDRSNTGASPTSVDQSLPTVRATYQNAVARVTMVDRHNFNSPLTSVDEPLSTVMACRDAYLTTVEFIAKSYTSSGQGYRQVSATDAPLGTVTQANHHNLCVVRCIVPSNFTNMASSIEHPTPTLLACRKHNYLMTGFMLQYHGGRDAFRRVNSLDDAMPTVATENHPGIIQYLVSNYGASKGHGVNNPLGAVVQIDKHLLLTVTRSQANYLIKYYGAPNQTSSLLAPLPTITTLDRFAACHAEFVAYKYGGGRGSSARRVSSVEDPVNTIGTTHTPIMVSADLNTASGNDTDRLVVIDETGRVMVIRSESEPIVFRRLNAKTASGNVIYPSFRCWAEGIRTVGNLDYGVDNRVQDIQYRMLNEMELKLAQGFPADYMLDPKSQTRSKAMIGNAVQVDIAEKIVAANCGPGSPYQEYRAKVANGVAQVAQVG
jgi:site-specific DNA-cytosine methylase